MVSWAQLLQNDGEPSASMRRGCLRVLACSSDEGCSSCDRTNGTSFYVVSSGCPAVWVGWCGCINSTTAASDAFDGTNASNAPHATTTNQNSTTFGVSQSSIAVVKHGDEISRAWRRHLSNQVDGPRSEISPRYRKYW
jgi:hypothetical protein